MEDNEYDLTYFQIMVGIKGGGSCVLQSYHGNAYDAIKFLNKKFKVKLPPEIENEDDEEERKQIEAEEELGNDFGRI